jgi:hypothetical protein
VNARLTGATPGSRAPGGDEVKRAFEAMMPMGRAPARESRSLSRRPRRQAPCPAGLQFEHRVETAVDADQPRHAPNREQRTFDVRARATA